MTLPVQAIVYEPMYDYNDKKYLRIRLPEKVSQYMADGCTCPILYPLGPDVKKMVDVFADWTP